MLLRSRCPSGLSGPPLLPARPRILQPRWSPLPLLAAPPPPVAHAHSLHSEGPHSAAKRSTTALPLHQCSVALLPRHRPTRCRSPTAPPLHQCRAVPPPSWKKSHCPNPCTSVKQSHLLPEESPTAQPLPTAAKSSPTLPLAAADAHTEAHPPRELRPSTPPRRPPGRPQKGANAAFHSAAGTGGGGSYSTARLRSMPARSAAALRDRRTSDTPLRSSS